MLGGFEYSKIVLRVQIWREVGEVDTDTEVKVGIIKKEARKIEIKYKEKEIVVIGKNKDE